jgi:hypothetical protein
MQRIHFLVITRRKTEMLGKKTYMAEDGRFWQLEKKYVQSVALEEFQKSSLFFKTMPCAQYKLVS